MVAVRFVRVGTDETEGKNRDKRTIIRKHV